MIERRRRAVITLAAVVVLMEGAAAERLGTRTPLGYAQLLDLLVGWVVVACGLVTWARVPGSRIGLLLVLVGASWFIGNLGDRTNDIGRLAEVLTFLYAGVLAHALFTYPTGRAVTALDRGLVTGGYLVALTLPLWQRDAGLVVISALLCAALLVQRQTLTVGGRHSRRPALWVGLFLAATVAAKGLVQPVLRDLGAPESLDVVTLVREAALIVAAVALAWSLLIYQRRRAAMTDLVVEMGGAQSPGLVAALRLALGDPGLEVGFPRPGEGDFIDEHGAVVRLPGPGGHRAAQLVELDGQPVAVLVHDRDLGDDPTLRDALERAAQMGARNRALRATLAGQVARLQASRRRLLEAGDAERSALEERLRLGAASRLEVLDARLGQLRGDILALAPAAIPRLDRAAVQLSRARTELDELARGLDPGLLAERGLDGALRELAERSPVPVRCSFETVPPSASSVTRTLYFVASEALTNVARHADAGQAWLRLAYESGRIALHVDDDGVGGADPERGSGLRGLRDRLDVLGGSLSVASRTGGGTRLVASIPSSSDHPVRPSTAA